MVEDQVIFWDVGISLKLFHDEMTHREIRGINGKFGFTVVISRSKI